jgi:hypothetical protein
MPEGLYAAQQPYHPRVGNRDGKLAAEAGRRHINAS